MLSFVVPAHNEEALIGRAVRSLHESARALGQPYEIVVVDDASTDRTAEIAYGLGARVVSINRRQISAARNAGAAAAVGERLFFMDADSEANAEAVRAAWNVFEAGAVGGGGSIRFDGPLPLWVRLAFKPFVLVYHGLGLVPGSFIFCSRDAFNAAGGFDETVYAGEEIWLSRALRKHGKFVILREYVLTSGRKARTYRLREFLWTVARVAAQGRRAGKSRRALDLWYEKRRPDPYSPPERESEG